MLDFLFPLVILYCTFFLDFAVKMGKLLLKDLLILHKFWGWYKGNMQKKSFCQRSYESAASEKEPQLGGPGRTAGRVAAGAILPEKGKSLPVRI